MQLNSKGRIQFSLFSVYKAEILQGYPSHIKKSIKKTLHWLQDYSILILNLPQTHT